MKVIVLTDEHYFVISTILKAVEEDQINRNPRISVSIALVSEALGIKKMTQTQIDILNDPIEGFVAFSDDYNR